MPFVGVVLVIVVVEEAVVGFEVGVNPIMPTQT